MTEAIVTSGLPCANPTGSSGPVCDKPHAPTRRTLLQGTAATVLSTLAAGQALAAEIGPQPGLISPDAALLALYAQLLARDVESNAVYTALDEAGALRPGQPDCGKSWRLVQDGVDRFHLLLDKISSTPAQTPHGLLVKARLVGKELMDGDSGYGEALVTGLIADLERIAGGQAHG